MEFTAIVLPFYCIAKFNSRFSSLVTVPSASKKELAQLLKKVSSIVPGLHAVDIDIPLSSLCEDDSKFQLVTLGRQFHISLGRTVPIRVHQIDSIVVMLRQKLQCQRRSDYISLHILLAFNRVIEFNELFYCKQVLD